MGEGGLSTPEERDTGEGAEGGIGHKTQVKMLPRICCETTDVGACKQTPRARMHAWNDHCQTALP